MQYYKVLLCTTTSVSRHPWGLYSALMVPPMDGYGDARRPQVWSLGCHSKQFMYPKNLGISYLVCELWIGVNCGEVCLIVCCVCPFMCIVRVYLNVFICFCVHLSTTVLLC